MSTYVLPPLLTTLDPPPSPLSLHYLSSALLLVTYTPLVLLLCDWATHFRLERKYVWSAWTGGKGQGRLATRGTSGRGCMRWTVPGRKWKVGCFAACRYLTLVQTVWVVVQLTVGRYSSGACSAARALPFGFSLASFATHLFLAYRMYGVFAQSLTVFYSLVVMSLVDLGLQLVADVLIQPVYLAYSLSADGSSTTSHVCYIIPTTRAFSIAFLSPTVYHHTVLLLTLFASWRHWATEQALAAARVKTPSLMKCLRREHAGYVLAICLINFANVILVLQQAAPAYQLIHYLPSLVLTHLLLSSLYFTLEQRLDRSPSNRPTARSSMRYSLPAIVTTPTGSPPPGTVNRQLSLHGPRSLSRADRTPQRLSHASIDLLLHTVSSGGGEGGKARDVPPTLQEKRLSKRGGDSASTLEIKKPPIPPRSSLRPTTLHSVVLIHPRPPGNGEEGGTELDLPTATTFTTASPGAGDGVSSVSPTTPGSAVPLFHLPTREIVRQASSSKGGSPTSPVSPTSATSPLPPSSARGTPAILPRLVEVETPSDHLSPPPSAPPTLPFPSLLPFPSSSRDLLSAPSPSSRSSHSSSPSSHRCGGYAADESRSPSPYPDEDRSLASKSREVLASPAQSTDALRSFLTTSEQGSAESDDEGACGGDSTTLSASASSYATHTHFGPPYLGPPLEATTSTMLPPSSSFYHHPPSDSRTRLHTTSTSAMSVLSASQVEGYLSRSVIERRPGEVVQAQSSGIERKGQEKEEDEEQQNRSVQPTPEGFVAPFSRTPLPPPIVHVRRPTDDEEEDECREGGDEEDEDDEGGPPLGSGTGTKSTSGETTAYESAVDPALHGSGRRGRGRTFGRER